MPLLELQSRADLQAALRAHRQAGRRIALVPTMGNLHAGHLSLLQQARQHADTVVTSIFVNPTQFAEGEDFDSYPRTLDADRQALQRNDCDILFAPGHGDIYPFDITGAISIKAPASLAGRLCGARRPGHFDGVLTVVARLLLITQADIAVFGEKDYQQLLLIERMCSDLGFGTRIVRAATVREASGLAMSSRNQNLSSAQRQLASALYRQLQALRVQIHNGDRDYPVLMRAGVNQLEAQGINVDYLQIVNAYHLEAAASHDRQLRILVAAKLPGARLIDNIAVELV